MTLRKNLHMITTRHLGQGPKVDREKATSLQQAIKQDPLRNNLFIKKVPKRDTLRNNLLIKKYQTGLTEKKPPHNNKKVNRKEDIKQKPQPISDTRRKRTSDTD